jgi:hypothetical protein
MKNRNLGSNGLGRAAVGLGQALDDLEGFDADADDLDLRRLS